MEAAERIPQAIKSEQAVIGSILVSGDGLVDECVELGLRAEEFSTQKHRVLYETILRLHGRQSPLELPSLVDALTESGNSLEDCGGLSGISLLIDDAVGTDSLAYYISQVKQSARRRRLFQACNLAGNLLLDDSEDALIEAERLLGSTMQEITPNKFEVMEDLLLRYLGELEQRGIGTANGINTGFRDYDMKTHGLQRGELVVIAARPSQGKTTLAMNWAENVSKSHHSAAVFSLEMSNMALAEKMLSRAARIDSYRLRGGFFDSKSDWQLFSDAVGRFQNVKLNLCDECGLNASQIKARARRMANSRGLDVVLVDFLQLMTGSKRDQNRFEMVGENAREMKNLARELNISVVLLSQLNRSVEGRSDPEPQLSDLRESGEIEQVADVIAFLYHEKTDDDLLITVKLGKNRNGAQGNFKLNYHRAVNRFESVSL